MNERIYRIMATVFHLDPEKIDENVSQANIDAWDSITHINLVLAIEQELGVRFRDEQIPQLVDFRSIQHAVAQQKAAA